MECKYHKAKKALQVEYEEYLDYYKNSVVDKSSKEWIEEGKRKIRLLEELLYNLFEIDVEFDFED